MRKVNFKPGDDGLNFESIEFNFNTTPVCCNKGLIVGADYQDWILGQAVKQYDWKASRKISCARFTLISKNPISAGSTERIGTFVFPPGSFEENKHPIRVF